MSRRQAMKLAASIGAIATSAVVIGGQRAQAQDEQGGEPKLVLRENVLWEKCWEERILGRRVEVCVKILERDGKFYLRIDRLGEIELINGETELSLGPFKIKLKISDIEITDGRLRALRLRIQACLGGTCRTLFNDRIVFNYSNFKGYSNLVPVEESGLTYSYESDTKED